MAGIGNSLLAGTNTYTGNTTILSGNTLVGGNVALGPTAPWATPTTRSSSATAPAATTPPCSPAAISRSAATSPSWPAAAAPSCWAAHHQNSTFTGNLTLFKDLTLTSAATGANTTTFNFVDAGGISGNYNVTVTGTGQSLLPNANTYTGNTSILSGTLLAGNNCAGHRLHLPVAPPAAPTSPAYSPRARPR